LGFGISPRQPETDYNVPVKRILLFAGLGIVLLVIAGAAIVGSAFMGRQAITDGFEINGTDIRAAVPKRGQGEVSVRVRLERSGRYEFACDRMCGAGHDFMRGVITVAEAGRRTDGRR